MSKKRTRPERHPTSQAEIDDQVARLRAVLKLMASGSGAMALGAAHKVPATLQISSEDRAIKVAR